MQNKIFLCTQCIKSKYYLRGYYCSNYKIHRQQYCKIYYKKQKPIILEF